MYSKYRKFSTGIVCILSYAIVTKKENIAIVFCFV
jgi:hypothetical protein